MEFNVSCKLYEMPNLFFFEGGGGGGDGGGGGWGVGNTKTYFEMSTEKFALRGKQKVFMAINSHQQRK